MKDVFEIVAYGAVIPAVSAIVIVVILRRCLPIDLYDRYAAAGMLAAAFFLGYVLLPSWAPLVPDRHWQWLPYLGIGAAITAAPSCASGVWWGERKLLQLAFTLVAAFLLVPTWQSLQPPRPTSIAILGSYLFLIISLLEPLATRFPVSRLLAMFSIVAISSSLIITYHNSLKFGWLAGIVGAGLAGGWLSSKTFASGLNIRAAIPVVVTLLGGIAYITAVGSTPPSFELLVFPAAPALLWLFTFKQMNQSQGRAIVALQYGAVLAPIIIVFIRMLFSDLSASA